MASLLRKGASHTQHTERVGSVIVRARTPWAGVFIFFVLQAPLDPSQSEVFKCIKHSGLQRKQIILKYNCHM